MTVIILPSTPIRRERVEMIVHDIELSFGKDISFFSQCPTTHTDLGVHVQLLPHSHLRTYIDQTLINLIGTFDRLVIVRDEHDQNPHIEWDNALGLKVYRDRALGYHGLRKVYDFDDSNKAIKQHFPDVFGTLSSQIENGFIYFPYGYTFRMDRFGDADELGFRLPPSWQALKDRASDVKVVCFFGGSACFSILVPEQKTFAAQLQAKLDCHYGKDKVIVLNFGVPGNTILNEMMNYVLFASLINPDVVIAHDGFNDLIYGQVADSFLQKKYLINYPIEQEAWGKKLHGSVEELNSERTQCYAATNPSVTIRAYFERKKQFEHMVQGLGGYFIAALQPIMNTKVRLSVDEKYLLTQDNQKLATMFKQIDMMYKRFNAYSIQNGGFAHSLNVNECFTMCDETQTHFGDMCHLMEHGEAVIADLYFEELVKVFHGDK